ncbi:MAG: sugar phosphate isomerase/epimerase [Eubacteriales bacterium]|nr:sugar phosphate isomerase/epimerase [Eubacteriales bacterium]
MKIGVNTFGPKFALYEDYDKTMARLKEGMIGSLEPCIAFEAETGEEPQEMPFQIPEEIIKKMAGGIWNEDVAAARCAKAREDGFEIVSVHVMALGATPKTVEVLVPKLVAFGKENNVKYYVLSLMVGLEKMKDYVPSMRYASEELAKAGITLCYHNHEIECYDENGDTALDYLLRECPDLMLEMDMGWAKFAGKNPVEYMRTHADRLKLVHLKDIRPDACPENRDSCFTIVGEGSIPLKEILAEAKAMGIPENSIIIDQDDSEGDIIEDILAGARHVNE